MPERRAKIEAFEKPRQLAEFISLRRLTRDDIIAVLDRQDEIFLIYLG